MVEADLEAVELSPSFQVAQLILNWKTNAVRVMLGAICLSISSILPTNDSSDPANPVMLPQGRAS